MPSSQVAPIGPSTGPQTPVAASHWPTSHSTLSAEQSLGLPPTHWPPWQVLSTLQRSPVSTQGLLSLKESGVPTQSPVAASQLTLLHSASGENVHFFGSPMHCPVWQTPLISQRSVGVQVAPS